MAERDRSLSQDQLSEVVPAGRMLILDDVFPKSPYRFPGRRIQFLSAGFSYRPRPIDSALVPDRQRRRGLRRVPRRIRGKVPRSRRPGWVARARKPATCRSGLPRLPQQCAALSAPARAASNAVCRHHLSGWRHAAESAGDRRETTKGARIAAVPTCHYYTASDPGIPDQKRVRR